MISQKTRQQAEADQQRRHEPHHAVHEAECDDVGANSEHRRLGDGEYSRDANQQIGG